MSSSSVSRSAAGYGTPPGPARPVAAGDGGRLGAQGGPVLGPQEGREGASGGVAGADAQQAGGLLVQPPQGAVAVEQGDGQGEPLEEQAQQLFLASAGAGARPGPARPFLVVRPQHVGRVPQFDQRGLQRRRPPVRREAPRAFQFRDPRPEVPQVLA
nr:hypothetical protein [Streptomyces triculaminicus]